MVEALNIVMLAGLAVTAIAIARLRNLFAVTMLSGIYSLLSAGIFVLLDAVDVAFTEAAVGAGITTVLFLGTLILTDREAKPRQFRWQATAPLALVVLMGIGLIYATFDPQMPRFGDANAPGNKRLVPEFLAELGEADRQGQADRGRHPQRGHHHPGQLPRL